MGSFAKVSGSYSCSAHFFSGVWWICNCHVLIREGGCRFISFLSWFSLEEDALILWNVIALTALVIRIDCIDSSCTLLCFCTLALKCSFAFVLFSPLHFETVYNTVWVKVLLHLIYQPVRLLWNAIKSIPRVCVTVTTRTDCCWPRPCQPSEPSLRLGAWSRQIHFSFLFPCVTSLLQPVSVVH